MFQSRFAISSSQTILRHTCLQNYGSLNCYAPGKTVVYNNTIYSPTAAVSECGMTLADWQLLGNDQGTTAHLLPPDALILDWAKALLGLE